MRVSIVATALDGQVPDRKSVVSMVHHIQNRGSGYGHVTNVLGTTKPMSSIEGATALDMNPSINFQDESLINAQANQTSVNETSSAISLDSANYLQNIENSQHTNENEQEVFDDHYEEQATENNNNIPINQDMNQENEETPNLFSDDQTESENKDSKNEVKELEMFESLYTEEDFEIPAFLRRQRN